MFAQLYMQNCLCLFATAGCGVASVLFGVDQQFIFVIIDSNNNTPLHDEYRVQRGRNVVWDS